MLKTAFLLPLVDNEGVAFTTTEWNWLQDELVARFGGWSLEGTVEGAWRAEDGEVYRDRSFRYAVATGNLEALRDLLREAKARFRQEAIYLEVSQTQVEIL